MEPRRAGMPLPPPCWHACPLISHERTFARLLPPPFGPLVNVVHGIRAMAAPPSQNQPQANRQGVFGQQSPTSKVYTVHLKDGDERWYLTPEDAQAAQEQGVSVTPAQ